MKLQGSVFLITGGASGLGAATARMALDAGACVVVADLAAPAGWDEAGGRWTHVPCDVTKEEDGQRAVQAAMDRYGRLDVLVNAAGIAPAHKIQGKGGVHPLDLFRKTLEVNLVGSFNLMRLAVHAFIASGPLPQDGDDEASRPSCGVIVNTASVAAYDGQVGQSAYAASKGGIVALTLPAARELARDRIRVLTIAPGIFETPMMAGMPQAVQDSLAASVPHPSRLGRPAEYAALVRHIVENEYLNGEVIRLDGAIRMAPR